MKRLSQHILFLLRQNDTVALPGFGFFSFQHKASVFDKEEMKFLPPHTEIAFYPGIPEDDSLLVESYMRNCLLTESEALEMLEADLDTLQKTLFEEGEAKLKGIGTISSIDGILYFDSEYEGNGILPSIPLLSADNGLKKAEKRETCSAAFNQVNVIPENYCYHNPRNYYFAINKKVANFAATFLLVIAVAVCTLVPVGQPQSSPSTAFISPVKVYNETSADNNNEMATLEVAINLPETSMEVSRQIPETEANAEVMASEKYYAVVAVFKNEKQVEDYINGLSDDNNEFEVIRKGKNKYITVASDTNKASLTDKLSEIRKKYPDAWVYAEKNK